MERYESSTILSNVVVHGDIVYLAGVVPSNVDADIQGQTQQVLDRIDALLSMGSTDKSKLLSATIWLNDISHRNAMNEIWAKWVDPMQLPVRACIEAKLANPKFLVEIMVSAAR